MCCWLEPNKLADSSRLSRRKTMTSINLLIPRCTLLLCERWGALDVLTDLPRYQCPAYRYLHCWLCTSSESNHIYNMPTDVPPSYDTATHGQPAVQVTTPAGNTQPASADVSNGGGGLERSRTNETVSSISSDDLLSPGLVDEEGRKSMDDERRDLPDGWVRCFDPKSEHHFYVEEKTKRSIWM